MKYEPSIMRSAPLGLAALLCSGIAVAAAVVGGASAGMDAARLPRAEAVIREEMKLQKIPGLAFAVVDHGKVILAQGYGYANVEHSVPVITDTVFQSGSVGKQFTSAAVMLFVEGGRLSLDDPITRYLPEAPPEWADIRIHHLLTHTSGIRDYGYEASYDTRRAVTEDELVRMACAQPLEFLPDERYSYSNTGYLLLGVILDRLGGRHYSEVLRERIFEPLGMKSARLIDEAAIVPHRAAGYRLQDGHVANQQWVAPEQNTTADGSLYLSINDMIAWDRGLRAGRILSAASWHKVYTPVTLLSGNTYPYGFAWEVSNSNGQEVHAHSGGVPGFATYIVRYLGDDLSLIVLTNLEDADPERIARRIAGVLRDDLRTPDPHPIADAEPARHAALEQLLQRARAGTLTASDLPHVRGGFQPSNATGYRSQLDGLGDLQSLALVVRDRLGDDEHSQYLATFARGRRLVDYTVDSHGGTVDLDIDLAY
jgi:CubicO group peptidase (beta-lactamase class C family)